MTGGAGTIADYDEASLIELIVARCPTEASPVGPGDDAALLAAGLRRVLTTDALVEGTHFLRAHPPHSLGWKALAVNLSDVAAMGAVPEAFTLSAALPSDLPIATWTAFGQGLGAYARMHGVHLAGGDTVRSNGPLMLSLTAWGTLDGARTLCRSGGRAGDVVMVAGPIGRAGHGLQAWLAQPHTTRWAAPGEVPHDIALLEQHLQPTPPLWAGPWALAHGATAGMDLSDGLAADLPRLAAASDLVLEIDLARLPEDDLLDGVDPLARASHGEDYGLVVLVPPARVDAFLLQGFAPIGAASAPKSALPASARVLWRLGDRVVPLIAPRFSHFR